MKLRLNQTSKTCIHLWLLKLWQSLLSTLPVVFDRVESATKSLYGFDRSTFDVPSVNRIGPSEDLNAKVAEFLRLEEKTGVPFAVSVVFDATQSTTNRFTSLAALERGFSFRDEAPLKSNTSTTLDSQNALASFPALFMRGTVQTASPRLTGMRRNNARKNTASGGLLHEGISKKEPPEYSSWPYTSWPNLIPLLRSQARSTGRLTEEHWEWFQADSETSFHGTPINNNMWFVVMTRAVDEGRWNRRRSSTMVEEELQDNLNEIVSCLKFTEIFKRAHVLEIRRGRVESGSSFSTESGGKMLLGSGGHSDFVDLLQSFKEELGLRSPRTRETLTSSYGLRLRSGRFGRSPGNVNRRAGSQPSHHAFFLGGQLMNAI